MIYRLYFNSRFLFSAPIALFLQLSLLFLPSLLHAEILIDEQKLVAFDAATGDEFGTAVAISGDTAVIGVPLDDFLAGNSGSVYVYVKTVTGWFYQATVRAPDPTLFDHFGQSVAIDGNTLVVGTRDTFTLPGIPAHFSQGAVYVFTRSGATWFQQAKLQASDPSVGADFGSSVAIDGDTIVVGAKGFTHNNGLQDRGAAYVFQRNGIVWSQQARLDSAAYLDDREFGYAVDVSGDWVSVGSPGALFAGGPKGKIDFFLRNGSNWDWQHDRTPITANQGDRFGTSVAILGSAVVVGAPGDDNGSANSNYDSGAVYLYEPDPDYPDPNVWFEEEKLQASTISQSALFGNSVSISEQRILVGADQDISEIGVSAGGTSYLFERVDNVWNELSRIVASDAHNGDDFGAAVALSEETALVGAPGNDDDGNDSGSAYTFDFHCNEKFSLPGNVWRQISLPCDPGSNNTVADVFGDDGLGTYGANWLIFSYDAENNTYINPGLNDVVQQGVGYWITHSFSGVRELDMPPGSTPTTASSACSTAECFEIKTIAQNGLFTWNMIGHPFRDAVPLIDINIRTENGSCANGCDVDLAESLDIFHNQLFTNTSSGYKLLDTSDGKLEPWTAYWTSTLVGAAAAKLPTVLIPSPQ